MLKLILFLAIISSPQLAARQLAFSKTAMGAETKFDYHWQDSKALQHNLSFAITGKDLSLHGRKQKNYQAHIAQRHVLVDMYKRAQQVDPKEARIHIQQIGSEIRVKVTSDSANFSQKWQHAMLQHQQQAFDQYLSKNYYTRFFSHLGEEGIKPDHIRYASESQTALLPVAQAIYSKLNPNSDSREYINLLLSWIQSIPYNSLENRLESNGAGYAPPIDVLNDNQGDCDSKTTLAAALIRALIPNMPLAIIYLPDHALLAASIPHRQTDPVKHIDGTAYLLMEPTGPTLMPLGEIADKSARHISAGMFSYERLH